MNDAELTEILKASRVLERPVEYWDEFPGRVTAECRLRESAERQEPALRKLLLLTNWWATVPRLQVLRQLGVVGFCVTLITIGLVLAGRWLPESASSAERRQLAQARQYYRELDSLFPNQVQTIIFDSKGPRFVLADRPNVVAASPLFIRLCDAQGCSRYVTFSGQRIRFSGQEFEVLSNCRGEILFVGDHSVWSSVATRNGQPPFKIEARLLQAAS
jgi:hypothetical protein